MCKHKTNCLLPSSSGTALLGAFDSSVGALDGVTASSTGGADSSTGAPAAFLIGGSSTGSFSAGAFSL